MKRIIDNPEIVWKIFTDLYVPYSAYYSSNDLYHFFLKRDSRDIDYGNADSLNDENTQKLLMGRNLLKDEKIIQDLDWYYCISKDFRGDKKHRLYIPANNQDTMKLVFEFIRRCAITKNPFYLKYHFDRDRLDRLIIYPTNDQLPKCVELLREIAVKYPDIISNMPDVPMTTVPLDGWIGYAVEDDSKNTGSYNRKIADSLLAGFRSTILFNRGLINLNNIDINRFIECYALSLGGNGATKSTAASQLTECLKDNNVRAQLIDRIKRTYISIDDLENDNTMISLDFGNIKNYFNITASMIIDYMKLQYKEIINVIGEDEFKRQLIASVNFHLKQKGVDSETIQERLSIALKQYEEKNDVDEEKSDGTSK